MAGVGRVLPWLVLATLWSGFSPADGRLNDTQRAFVLSHGPWPPVTQADPSNRFSGDKTAIGFGRALFLDRRLSQGNERSCASCHRPDQSFAERLPRSMGRSRQDRNAISLANLPLHRWYGRAGTADTLWGQSIRPLLAESEHGLSPLTLKTVLVENADLARSYRQVVGAPVADDSPEQVLVNVAKVLAAYQETLVTPRTVFDDYRDALDRGDGDAMAGYPAAALRGLALFTGEGQCSVCHFGPNFTSGEFHHIGLLHFVDGGRVDPGRFSGIREFRESPYTLSGSYSDRPMTSQTTYVSQNSANWGAFRVPSLRNVANTAPYMHDGSLATLEDVVRHYSQMDMNRLHVDGESILKPLDLTETELRDLVAFLETLSGAPTESLDHDQ